MSTVPINFRIEEALKDKCQKKADADKRSLSAWIRIQLEKLVESK